MDTEKALLNAIGVTEVPEGLVNPNGERVESYTYTPREDNKRLCREVNFEPLGNWCLVKEVDGVVQSGRIIIPEAYGQTFRKGIVVSHGVGTVYGTGAFIECTVRVGDVILFGKAAGLDCTLKEGAFKLIRESEMFGKVSG